MTSDSSPSRLVDSPSDSLDVTPDFSLHRTGRRSQSKSKDFRPQIILDPMKQSDETEQFECGLRRRLVGQDRAIRQLARVYQVDRAYPTGEPMWRVGIANSSRPLARWWE